MIPINSDYSSGDNYLLERNDINNEMEDALN